MSPKVFVSYSHDSEAHRLRVDEFVSRLRRQNIAVIYDEDIAKIGGPDEGWPRWCERQIVECEYVLVCCTAKFHERFNGEQMPDTGLGVAWEAQSIRQYLYRNPNSNRKVRVLLLQESDRPFIPMTLQPYHVFVATHDESYAGLLGWLKITGNTHAPTSTSVTWLSPAKNFERRLADRLPEFSRFADMLSGLGGKRALLIQGPSSSGKTVLIHECLSYAQHLGAQYAYVDFKGGLSLDEALTSLVFNLGRGMLSETSSCIGTARSYALIADLQRVREPLVLTFDTYQDGSQECKNWVETQLLTRLDRCPALIVAVAGHEVPAQSARSWAPLACTVSLPPIGRVDDWIDFAGRTYGITRLERGHVEALTLTLKGDPGQVSAMLEVIIRALPEAQLEPTR